MIIFLTFNIPKDLTDMQPALFTLVIKAYVKAYSFGAPLKNLSAKTFRLSIKIKMEDEIRRFNKLQKIVNKNEAELIVENDVNIGQYAKYLLKEGNVSDKRELLANLKSKIIYTNKKLKLRNAEI